MVNLNGTYQYKLCSRQKGPQKFDLQELWSSGYNWGEILPARIQNKWMENVQTMNNLLAFEFDRKLKPSHAVGVPQVHGFCDGGEKADSAVIFLRWRLKCVPFLIKSFVAPLKKKTIPRLELTGCLTVARMYDTCRTSLQVANIQDCKRIFWVDSSTVLSWIRTAPRQFKLFVSARVAEIQETVRVTFSLEEPNHHDFQIGHCEHCGFKSLTHEARRNTGL